MRFKGKNIIILFSISKIFINPDYFIQWLLHGSNGEAFLKKWGLWQTGGFKYHGRNILNPTPISNRIIEGLGFKILWLAYIEPTSYSNPIIIEGVQNIMAPIYWTPFLFSISIGKRVQYFHYFAAIIFWTPYPLAMKIRGGFNIFRP